MSKILAKSKENLDTATLLVDNGFYLPSAHSAYYAVFLMAKYLLNNNDLMNYAVQNEQTRYKDSHNIIQLKVFDLLAKLEDSDSIKYNSLFSKLKKMRKKADYTNSDINSADLLQNVQYAKEFMKGIIKHYSL